MAKRRIFLDPDQLKQLYQEQGLCIDSIAERLGTSHGTVWRSIARYQISRRSLSEAITKHQRNDFSGNLNEKAYLIGFRLGDLWVRMNKPGAGSKTVFVSCHTTRPEQIELFRSLFEKYGHTHLTKNASNTGQIICYLNTSFDFLLAKEDKIPNWIQRDRELFLSFLAGYVDAEGSFSVSHNGYSSFQLKSYDLELLRTIAVRLNEDFQISCNPPRVAQKRGSTTGKGYRLNKDAWVFAISRKESLFEFCKLMAQTSKHPKRKSDIARVISHIEG